MPRIGPPVGLLALQRIIAEGAKAEENAAPAAGNDDRLPFESTELGKGGWNAAAILKNTQIDPSSAIGKAIVAGLIDVLRMNTRLCDQVESKLSAAGDASTLLQAALGQAWVEINRVSFAIISHKATHGDLIAIAAMDAIVSKSAVEQVPRVIAWCLALEKRDYAAVAATAQSTPPSTWNAVYDEHKSFLKKPYDEFESGLGEIRATSKGGLSENKGRPISPLRGRGTPGAVEITLEMLKECYPGLAKDVASDARKEAQARNYCRNLNMAFKVMQIDTVEAQANYLAHAFVESDQFRQFTETQGWKDVAGTGTQKWVDQPEKLELDTKYLAKTYNDTSTESGREKKATVNPHGNYEFIGRGPVQVTHQAEYVEVIAMLEKAAAQYEQQARGNMQLSEYAAVAREAANAIKADPRQAANPKYAFLVSAAFMKKRGIDVSVGWTIPGAAWTGEDVASGWVAGGAQAAGSPQAAALVDKAEAYKRILGVLMREAKKRAAAGGLNIDKLRLKDHSAAPAGKAS